MMQVAEHSYSTCLAFLAELGNLLHTLVQSNIMLTKGEGKYLQKGQHTTTWTQQNPAFIAAATAADAASGKV